MDVTQQTLRTEDGQTVVVATTEPGSASHAAMTLLVHGADLFADATVLRVGCTDSPSSRWRRRCSPGHQRWATPSSTGWRCCAERTAQAYASRKSTVPVPPGWPAGTGRPGSLFRT
ncbi:hypothetical protein [Micromonospora sp. NBC_00330]|uniref:hypothetical protein n=1 Tax=Micromonospora sp. NBC_00330 TaxID=2903585 RepID=UPI003FA5885D